MDKLSTSYPRFTVSLETASFLASSGILQQSWDEICGFNTENKGPFLLNRHEGVAYLSFSSLYMEVKDAKYEDCNIHSADFVSSPTLKGDDDQPALVHKGALNRFQYILQTTDLESQVQALQDQSIIFGGHSIGGAVAALAAIWFLGKGVRSTSPYCITFGSPLVGDARFEKAIVRQDWCGRFCHVVSQHDIVPRMLLAPFQLIAEPLNTIAPHLGSGSDRVIQEASRALVNNVLQSISCGGSLYRPFGTYIFCSMNRAACIDDSEAALKILHYTVENNQGLTYDQILGACISEHTGYGDLLKDVVDNLQNSWEIANFVSESSFEMGIALTVGAIGIGVQNAKALDALREAGEKQNEQNMNIDRLNFELSKNQSKMAMLEWYKLRCNDRGYYDCFKDGDRTDIDANLIRANLEIFWDDIIEMVEKHQLPSDFQTQNKWINAGNAYRKLVEPLDIANHYQTGSDGKQRNMGNYLSAGVRHHRHEVLEKWMKEKDRTRTRSNRGKKARTKFASLTEDSCFWAHVEEALKTLQRQIMNAQEEESLVKFEDYVWKMIENRSISAEVFLEGSSFMKWWGLYRDLRYQSQSISSDLFNFMTAEGWKAVGN